MVPFNHPFYPYPYNLEDRIKYILKKIKKIVNRDFTHKVIKQKNGSFLNNINPNYPQYVIEINDNKYFTKNKNEMLKLKFQLKDNKWQKKLI